MSITEGTTIEAQSLLRDADRTINLIRGCLLICRQDGGFEGSMLQIPRLRSIADAAGKAGIDAVATAVSSLALESVRVIGAGNVLSDHDACILLDRVAEVEAEMMRARMLDSNEDVDIAEFLDSSFDGLWRDRPATPADEPASFGPVDEDPDGFEPDEEMLAIFRIEADELLSNIETGIEELNGSPGDRQALWEVRRNAHTLKGAAGIIGLKQLSQAAHKIEDLLDHLSESEAEPRAEDVQLLTVTASLMRDLAGDPNNSVSERIETVFGQLDALIANHGNARTHVLPARSLVQDPAPAQNDAPATEPIHTGRTKNAPRPIVRVALTRLNELSDSVRELLLSRTVMARRIEDLEKAIAKLSGSAQTARESAHQIEYEIDTALFADGRSVASPERTPANGLRLGDSPGAPDFDALEMDRYTFFHKLVRDQAESTQDCHSLANTIDSLSTGLNEAFDLHRRLVEQVQQRVMQIRLIRFGSIATRLERAVRVTCQEQQKTAEIVVADQEVEIDTDVLDALVEPLMHLVKNAVAHGIESPDSRRLVGKPECGTITVKARNEGTHFIVSVSDDGRGISGRALAERAESSGLLKNANGTPLDAASRIELIFTPGLSTADELTMSAGRGVGLSIVKESIEDQGGTVSVETELHTGTTFTLRVPLEFAVARSVLVKAAGNIAAIPARSVLGLFEIGRDDLVKIDGGVTASIDGRNVPFRTLAEYFANGSGETRETVKVLLIGEGNDRSALAIDEFLSSEEIIIKALAPPLNDVPGLLGAALLGSGEAVPVIDPASMCAVDPVRPKKEGPSSVRVLRILIVDDSPSVRHMTANALKAAGCEPLTAMDGVDALNVLRSGPVPDAILSDVEMPEMDGFAFAEAVKSTPEYSDIPFLFITSRVSEKHRQRAAEIGITGHLAKPFTNADLVEVVRRICS